MKPQEIWRSGARSLVILKPGLYEVIALSGALLPFNVLKDHKQIYVDGGHNKAMGRMWGWFWKKCVYDYDDPQILSDWENGLCVIGDICLNYDHASNPKYLRGIRDYLRLTKKGDKYIGRLVRNGRHLGFFTLERVGD